MLQNRNKTKSFTLIELIVAITIALLLMATGAFILNKSSGIGQVTSDAELLSTFIGRARNLAANPDDVNAIGYGVSKIEPGLANKPSKFEIYKKWSDSAGIIHRDSTGESVTLVGSEMDDSFAVMFNTPSGTYDGDLTVSLFLAKKPAAANTKTIHIAKPGYVNVQ